MIEPHFTTILVWTLRLSIPMFLFWTYCRFQSKAITGSSEFVYSRSMMLQGRNSHTRSGDVPVTLPKLVTEEEAPKVFDAHHKRNRVNRRRTAREEEDAVVVAKAASEEKMHAEALLNYIAFNRKDRRNFLPDSAAPPHNPSLPNAQRISTESMERANKETQMVLKAAANFSQQNGMNLNGSEIAKDLWNQLNEASVEVTAKTFTLLIEACVRAKDLKGASEFLMSMEEKDHTPSAELLDKVMELYSSQKLHSVLDREHKKNDEQRQTYETYAPAAQQCPPLDIPSYGPASFSRVDSHDLNGNLGKSDDDNDKSVSGADTSTRGSTKPHSTSSNDPALSPNAIPFVPVASNAKTEGSELSPDAPCFMPMSFRDNDVTEASIRMMNAAAVPFQPMDQRWWQNRTQHVPPPMPASNPLQYGVHRRRHEAATFGGRSENMALYALGC